LNQGPNHVFAFTGLLDAQAGYRIGGELRKNVIREEIVADVSRAAHVLEQVEHAPHRQEVERHRVLALVLRLLDERPVEMLLSVPEREEVRRRCTRRERASERQVERAIARRPSDELEISTAAEGVREAVRDEGDEILKNAVRQVVETTIPLRRRAAERRAVLLHRIVEVMGGPEILVVLGPRASSKQVEDALAWERCEALVDQ
jgi:hypothetical protein